MQHTKRHLSLLLVSVLATFTLAVAPVASAHEEGSNTSGSSDTSESTSSSGSSTKSDVAKHIEESSDSSDSSTAEDNGGSLRDQAKQLLQTKRQNIKEHTAAQKQKACEQRQKSITTRTGNYATAAQRHLDVFNSIFTKVQAFHDDKKLNVTNYDTLVAAATAKQTAAQTAVDALKALNVQIDCTQPDPATTVATIKSAVSDARTALQDYRKSITDVIVALKGASTANNQSSTTDTTTTTTGGDQ